MTGKNPVHPDLAGLFEAQRGKLQGVAYRMLGSKAEAEDAVQEAWLRLSRTDANEIGNLGGWLTTVVSRVCLDMLRSRKVRGEEELGEEPQAAVSSSATAPAPPANPEEEMRLADSVGLALMIVLERLQPAERVAFVLHDMFDMPFEEIASVVGRTPDAARQLASRARRRVQGSDDAPEVRREANRKIIEAFLAASRSGDMTALLAVLDPDVVVTGDAVAARGLGGQTEVRGADKVAALFKGRAQNAKPALLDGEAGIVVAPQGKLFLAVHFRIEGGRIVEMSGIGDPAQLAALDISDFD
jgi:RNA polymerase sigma factor (sigma-70 family)